MLREEENRKQENRLDPESCYAALEVSPSPAAPVGPAGRWRDSASGSGVGVYPDGSICPCESAEEWMAVIMGVSGSDPWLPPPHSCRAGGQGGAHFPAEQWSFSLLKDSWFILVCTRIRVVNYVCFTPQLTYTQKKSGFQIDQVLNEKSRSLTSPAFYRF